MSAPLWLSIAALGVIGCLLAAALVWLGRHELRERRQARAVAALAARYRRASTADEPDESVTVAELIARAVAEGRPVRLNWNDDQDTTEADEDWPTAVLPRVRDADE